MTDSHLSQSLDCCKQNQKLLNRMSHLHWIELRLPDVQIKIILLKRSILRPKNYHTAIRLLLTEFRPRDVLKCSITSQFDFFAAVYAGGGEMCGGGMGTSIDIWAVRVWRNDAERRVMPDFREAKSCNNKNNLIE